jgi:crotonobetainyl-CoA:carnitine CoA-transferase CaiB-like acyl-CoA transferase
MSRSPIRPDLKPLTAEELEALVTTFPDVAAYLPTAHGQIPGDLGADAILGEPPGGAEGLRDSTGQVEQTVEGKYHYGRTS